MTDDIPDRLAEADHDRKARREQPDEAIEPLPPCRRCKHSADWHRHDDVGCHTTHPQPCEPNTAPFRCLGYDCERPGFPAGTPETRCGCLAYVKTPGPHGPVSERFMRHHYGAPR